MRKIKMMGIFVLIVAISFNFIEAQSRDSLKQKIVTAITDGANYSANVLLQENGKSKCDYNILQGKWYDYEPAWHTGQVVYGLVEAYRITDNPKYLQAAKRGGDWWIDLQIEDNPNLNGMLYAVHGDYVGEYIVFSTITDGANGIFNLYQASNDKKYAEVAAEAGEWMYNNMWDPKHQVFYDVVDSETGEVYKDRSPFHEDEEITWTEVSRPNNEGSFYKYLYQYTGKEKYKDIYIKQCESLLKYQYDNGLWMDFMPNEKESGYFHPRMNLWYAESLIEGYELTGKEKYLEAARKTAKMYEKIQHNDGTIYYKNYLDGGFKRGSISGSTVAFAGIVWLRLYQLGYGDDFKDNIQKSLDWLLINQYSPGHPDQNFAGAFIETRSRHKHGGLWITHRDIGTSFAIRFLADYYRYKFE